MTIAAFTFRSFLTAAAIAAAAGSARAEDPAEHVAERPAPKRQCFSTAQTREKIEAHKLVDPFSCMRTAAHEHNGEALGARLCRHDETLIYEISLLQPDGRIVKLLFNAMTGKPHSGHRDN